MDYILKLKEVLDGQSANIRSLANEVLDDPRFAIWPASIDKHHAEVGGLARHVCEVFDIAASSMKITNKTSKEVNYLVLYFAVLYHDVGKFYDYEFINPDKPYIHQWQKSKHNRLIHHISRSALMWSHDVSLYPELNTLLHDKVLHCILSHHGQRAYGSPVAPFTAEAWLLHLADSMSARLDDYNKIDILKVKE